MASVEDLRNRIRLKAGPFARLQLRRFTLPLRRLVPGLDRLSIRLPTGLYARSILIVVVPIVLLQGVVAYVFMERHWETVTDRLSSAVTADISAIIQVMESYPQDDRYAQITRIAADTFGLTISVLPDEALPATAPKPFFSLLDRTLSRKLREQIGRPFWIDTVGNSDLVEIRIKLEDNVLRVFARRSQAYASNSHIFLIWMLGTSTVLIAIALLFLRNQIKPILTLADAADSFGKGRAVADFRPRGAREVRQAAQAFMDMRSRIERQIEQRTTMLAGVSHDLRTILTRFKLELAMLPPGPETDALTSDIAEMSRMLEDYMDFAKGDGGERTRAIDASKLLKAAAENAQRSGHDVSVAFEGDPMIVAKPLALARCLSNLVGNAGKFAGSIEMTGRHEDGWLTILIDDDGPGIPEDQRDAVFRPFHRLDHARNVDDGGSGLGLSIARDIVHGHGGEITLGDSPLGGLQVELRFPA